ncbi:hypothetical protein PGTUg99_018996 [Puccinia graminis f. sp. tritici]|uniref:AMP-dependent synthetase/ligase domain-containing protein n=1 Tax=Puccinia graminis f. sp. tritici TaxID=56615 RepID=A0A5B0PLR2_PUCGR|nr:hypothetical protein PGTUg99_018996 [Puccinia graminis f. sp. tritici]
MPSDNSSHQNLLGPDDDGVPTLWDSFLKGYSLAGGSGNCIGTRLIWDHSSAQAGQPGPEYQWLSYAQVLARIRDISAGLIELFRPADVGPSGPADLPDSQDVLDRPRVALWCPSSPCWTISEYAAYRNSITVVSINDQLPAQAASKIIQDTHPGAVILSAHNFQRLAGYQDHQRRYQITSSRIGACDLESTPSPRSAGSPSAHGLKRTPLCEAAGPNASEAVVSSVTRHNRRPSQSTRVPQTSPPTSSSSAAPQVVRPQRTSDPQPIYILTDPLQLSSRTRSIALQLRWSFYSLEEVARIGHPHILASLPTDTPDHQPFEPHNVVHLEKLNPLRPGSETLAGIIYSSGTTGDPKPCVLSHSNFAATLAAFNALVRQERLRDLHTQDLVQFSYLPLHHIYEKQTQAWVMNQGGSIGFSSLEGPRFVSDLSLLKPTFLATTPSFLTHQILDRRLQFLNNFSSFKSPVESYLLNKAIESKLVMLKAGFGEQIWLWDRFVLGYLRDQLGGRLKWIVSGTSPLSKHVAELLSASLSVKITEGYGLTETCGAACITVEDGSHEFQVGHVGPPLPCCEIKLEKVEGLVATQENQFQEGRVYIRGANVFQGYLVPGTATSEERIWRAVDSEGWFATGDVGYMDEAGRLHLVDRLLREDGEGGSGSGMVLGQQIHHQFNMVDLCKIEQRLAGAMHEVAQIFVSGRTTETHAEVGVGLLGHLVGFVVVHRPAFLRWIADFHPPHNLLVDRHTDLYRTDPSSPSPHSNHDEQWEIVEEEPLTSASSSPQENLKPALPIHSSASPSLADRECQLELEKICQDPLVIKSFLNYLTRRAKSIGLKSPNPFTPTLSTTHLHPRDDDHHEQANEKGKSARIDGGLDDPPARSRPDHLHPYDHQACFRSLKSKNSRLLAHFSGRLSASNP